jgi:hypothetical protein
MLERESLDEGAVGTTAPPADESGAQGRLPSHLLPLPEGRWALWRCVGLRGSGFPMSELSNVTTSHGARAADAVLTCEADARRARSEAIAALRSKLEAGACHERATVERALSRLQTGKTPAEAGGELAGVEALGEFRRARVRLDAALLEFRQAFETDAERLSTRLREVAGTERFQEAVIWQNRQAFHTGIAPLLRQPPGGAARGSKQRQREEVVASYLQRYCAKNDTIGFFGPVGWASFVEHDEALTFQPGAGLVESRRVYFEGWCIDTLAEKLAADKAIRPWIAPRVRPFVRLDGNVLRIPFGGALKLAPDQAALLQACDGVRIARHIAEELIRNPYTTFRSEADVYSALEFMYTRKLIFWNLEVPIEARPEQTLQRLLERIDDVALRESALSPLAELVAARDAVAEAAGSAEELDRALGRLEATFTRLTGAAPTRSPGSMYAARTLVYEDCRRDLKLEIGRELWQSLTPPLHLLLKSARWLVGHAFDIYRGEFEKIYRRLAAANNSPLVEIVSFWMQVQPLLVQKKGEPLDTLVRDFQQRWSKILWSKIDAGADGQRRLQYSTEEIRLQASALFDAPDDVAKYARYHSPDIMIAARSVEAIRRGDYQFVLGELHAAFNTLSYLMFVEQHPAPEEFAPAWDVDIPERRVVPVLPKNFFGGAMRTKHVDKAPKDFILDFSNETPSDPTANAVPFGEFVVEEVQDGLTVRTHDGRLSFDAMQFFAMAVGAIVANCFKLTCPRRHTPRVNIDRLVVCRESWTFAASELTFAYEPDEAGRLLATRRWAARHQMPRHVFVATPVERKPFYLDFDSAVYIDIFSKIVRRTAREGPNDEALTITEMLPGPDEVWLTDAANNHYTSELRIVALDLAGWS